MRNTLDALWGDGMARIARGFGYAMLGLAAVLALIGASTWPPGGLMFALPFVFLIPAAFFALVGGVLLWIGQRSVSPTLEPDDPSHHGGI